MFVCVFPHNPCPKNCLTIITNTKLSIQWRYSSKYGGVRFSLAISTSKQILLFTINCFIDFDFYIFNVLKRTGVKLYSRPRTLVSTRGESPCCPCGVGAKHIVCVPMDFGVTGSLRTLGNWAVINEPEECPCFGSVTGVSHMILKCAGTGRRGNIMNYCSGRYKIAIEMVMRAWNNSGWVHSRWSETCIIDACLSDLLQLQVVHNKLLICWKPTLFRHQVHTHSAEGHIKQNKWTESGEWLRDIHKTCRCCHKGQA